MPVELRKYKPVASRSAKRTKIGTRNLCTRALNDFVFGIGDDFAVLLIRVSDAKIKNGITIYTHKRLINTPFANTKPISAPMVKDMKTRHTKPTMVVAELVKS